MVIKALNITMQLVRLHPQAHYAYIYNISINRKRNKVYILYEFLLKGNRYP